MPASQRGSLRRANKAMPHTDAIALLSTAWVARLATVGADGFPYVVPVCVAFRPIGGLGTVYFHCAADGHKLDNIAHNDKVCLQADDGGALVKGPGACECSSRYKSVVAFGTARVVGDADEKLLALGLIVRASGVEAGPMPEAVVARTTVVAVDLELVSGKTSD